MSSGPRSDRFGILVAVLGGLFVALATVLIILLVTGNGDDDDATTTTAAAVSTTGAGTTATTAPGTTEGTTTTTTVVTTTHIDTTTSTSTTTTTAPPFEGTVDQKTGPVQGTPAGRLSGIRSAEHETYTRVVFDFPAGGIPGYWVGYTGATTLSVLFYPLSWSTPYEPGIFDAGGSHAVGAGPVIAVEDAGMGAGSGEWSFNILLTSQKAFLVGTLADPPRVYVDIAN